MIMNEYANNDVSEVKLHVIKSKVAQGLSWF